VTGQENGSWGSRRGLNEERGGECCAAGPVSGATGRVREQLQLWCPPNSTQEKDGSMIVLFLLLVLLVEEVIAVAGVKVLIL